MEFYLHTLPNGIRCIHKRVKSSVAHCSLTIGAGSRDELPAEFGMAHLVEHTLFKGTEHRRAYHINCRLENLGGELNAYTTKEETVIHATTLRGDLGKAVELIADIVFHSTFPAREVEKEKEIILDEINSYKDSPPERIYDDFEDMLFEGSSLGHNILGSKAALHRYHSEHIRRFVGRTYNTDQMVFSSVGNLSNDRFVRLVERWLGNVPTNPRSYTRVPINGHTPFFRVANRNTHQAHCILGARAYDLQDTRRIPLSLLINVLGGPSANSLLNLVVREKNGLSYNIEAGYTPYSDSGIATIYFSCDKENTERCIELVNEQLAGLKNRALSARALSMARKQYIGQLCIAMESNEGAMLSAGKSLLVYNGVDDTEEIYRKIASIRAEDLMQAAAETFSNTSTLIYK